MLSPPRADALLSLSSTLFSVAFRHPSPRVQQESLATLAAVAAAEPLWGYSLLPAFLWLTNALTNHLPDMPPVPLRHNTLPFNGTGGVPGAVAAPAGGAGGSTAEGANASAALGRMALQRLPDLSFHWLVAGPVIQSLRPLALDYALAG